MEEVVAGLNIYISGAGYVASHSNRSDSNMEVIILSLTIYTLDHHNQYLTSRGEGGGGGGRSKNVSDSELFAILMRKYS